MLVQLFLYIIGALFIVAFFVFLISHFVKRKQTKWIKGVIRDEIRHSLKCPYCGAILQFGDKFCSNCGKDL